MPLNSKPEHVGHDHSDCHASHGGGEDLDHHADSHTGDNRKPCSPGDDETCGCGKSLTKLGVIGRPDLEIPAPAMVAIIPIADYGCITALPSLPARAKAAKPVLPPATSLLRLHCALTV